MPPLPKPTEPPRFLGEPVTMPLSDFRPPPVVEPPPAHAPTIAPGDAITIDTGKGTIEATVTAVTPVATGTDEITLEPAQGADGG
ncbi:hypothetical protein B1H26_40150 [Amycolatopsis sp. BJA-103]|nr:hypothetical protein BKN51_00280 [Amycolatopsis sp. BJA-103]PNE13443.1 hypothetical protein B1H26_40150 [Amycolatopsis sp. BJA-103]